MTKTNIIYAEDASGSRFSAGRVRYGRGCERHRFAVRESQAAKNRPTSGPAGALQVRPIVCREHLPDFGLPSESAVKTTPIEFPHITA
jgi:hypothetical protein